MKKFLRIFLIVVILGFALIGFGLTSAWIAVKLHITDDPGAVDYNDRVFQELAENDKQRLANDTAYKQMTDNRRAMDFYKIMIIGKFYPYNANNILAVAATNPDPGLLEKMITAVEIRMLDTNAQYRSLIAQGEAIFNQAVRKDTNFICFPWMNISEWQDLKVAILKDKALIDSAAKVTGVEPRLIVACLIGEQIRLFNSKREMYKKVIGPLKILSVESQFSLGVTGVKDFTAIAIEKNLKDTSSIYYLGKKYEDIITTQVNLGDSERFRLLTSYRNHYYQYVYPGLFLHQVKKQWERSGFDISNRPEILVTLYNVGFWMSKPNANPRVGGSRIVINNQEYTFGGIGFDFYYSGELAKEFPYTGKLFTD